MQRLPIALTGLLLVLASAVRASDPGSVSFNRDIRPILSDHCFACHGPDEKTRKADLRFDLPDAPQKPASSGKTAIVPGHPDRSELVARILTSDPDDHMPPAETKKPLSPRQIELLQRWVAQGAVYEGHWAYLAPQTPEIPSTTTPDWARNEIDSFILNRLERENLPPSPEAPKPKLLRRVTLDLTGLPPTVEELDAFLADDSSKAYDKVVDRLLASPHYGERMAQQWLDLARYGETQGYHHDRHRDMWHWRDWVIRAFNHDMPFDQFTVEQLAGDLLPNPTRDQLIATGFHRNEMTTSEGGALPEEYIVKYAVGRVDTTARVWLGTSMACAECHDHKYDPISQKDYYRFFAFFFDTPENGLDAQELNPTPRITLESPEQRDRARLLDQEVETLTAAEELMASAPREPWDRAQAQWESWHRDHSLQGWPNLRLLSARISRDASLTAHDDGSIAPPADPPRSYSHELTLLTDATHLNALRLQTRPSPDRPTPPFLLQRVSAEIRSAHPDRVRQHALEHPLVSEPWSVVGPFQAASDRDAREKAFGPESSATVHLDQPVGPTDQRWTRPPGPDTEAVVLPSGPRSVSYLTRNLRSEGARILDADLHGPAAIRAWLNGQPISLQRPPQSTPDQPHRLRLWLRPGDNRLVLRVVHGSDPSRIRLRYDSDPVTSATLRLTAAAADVQHEKSTAAAVLDDRPETGWAVGTHPVSSSHALYLTSESSFGFPGGTEIVLRLQFQDSPAPAGLGLFHPSTRHSESLAEFVSLPDALRSLLLTPPDQRTDAQLQELRVQYRRRFVPEVRQARDLLAAKRKERDDFRASWPTAMVMQAAQPTRETQIRIRGQYNNLGEKVSPGVPTSLLPWREDLPPNRLGLARWLVDPAHPLTARVVVNQFWQRLFGTGLVKTSEEFGAQGEWPSHPDLLDWLATRFVRSGWKVKDLQRLIVTSATYRQDSIVRPQALERDPENRLLARGPRFRLDAENLRDLAMSVSGLLNPAIGGPSVYPFQPPGLWGQVSFEGTRDYVQSQGTDNYRRGLYTYWRRSIPYAAFTIFDAPSREVCTVRRPRTNTPLQALALLNDPVYVEAARALGARILAQTAASQDDRIRLAFRLVLSRAPSDREHQIIAAALTRELARFSADREAANRLIHVGPSAPPIDVDIAELAAWTLIANTLLNLDESLTRG